MRQTPQNKLKNIIELMQLNLVQYLAKAGFTGAVTEEQVAHIEKSYIFIFPRIPYPRELQKEGEPNKFIVPEISGGRNFSLTAKRIANVLLVNHTLQTKLAEAIPTLTEAGLIEKLAEIKAVLDAGLQSNNQLSTTHGKPHRTFKDNRALGWSIFSSWKGKTFFQSRARSAFEKCLDQLDKFQTADRDIPSASPTLAR